MPFVTLGSGGAAAGSDSGFVGSPSYTHVQDTPSTVWDIPHHMGYDPAAFLVVSVAGERWYPQLIEYIEPGHTARLNFAEAIAGTARLS